MVTFRLKLSIFQISHSKLSIKTNSISTLVLPEASDTSNRDTLPFNTPRVRGINRVGPHHPDVISIIVGSLLGNGHMEKEKGGSRMKFLQGEIHIGYILWLHSVLAELGYCIKNPPILRSRAGKDGKVNYFLRFESFTFTSFNDIREEFYIKGRKTIPSCLSSYLTPLALAV